MPRVRCTSAVAATLALAGVVVGLALPASPLVLANAATRPVLPALSLTSIAGTNLAVAGRLALGALSFGLYSALELFLCGLVVGLLAGRALAAGVPVSEVLLWIAPHGLLEFSGLVLFGSLGFQGGWLAWQWLRGRPPGSWTPLVRSSLHQAAAGFALIAVASLIEVFVTPRLAIMVMR